MRILSRTLVVVLLIGLFASGASGAGAVTPREALAPVATHTILFPVNGFNYSPADIIIFAGETVEWSGPFTFHPLVSDDNLWPVVNTGNTFQFTFTQPGVYRYHCQIHGGPGGVGMSGVITVTQAFRIYLPMVFS